MLSLNTELKVFSQIGTSILCDNEFYKVKDNNFFLFQKLPFNP